MRWAPALLMRSSFHPLSSAPSGIAVPGCSRSLSMNPSSDIDMYKMTFRMTYLLYFVPVRLTVVEQHPEPSDGHRCSGFLEDGPQRDLVRLQHEASGPAPQVVDHARRTAGRRAHDVRSGSAFTTSRSAITCSSASAGGQPVDRRVGTARETVHRDRRQQDQPAASHGATR